MYYGQFYIFPLVAPKVVLSLPFLGELDPIFDWTSHTIRQRESAPSFFQLAVNAPSDVNSQVGDIPESFKEFEHVFSKQPMDHLPSHSPFDHTVEFVAGASLPFGPLYQDLPEHLQLMREYIDEMLCKRFICHSKSICASPMLYVPKKDGK